MAAIEATEPELDDQPLITSEVDELTHAELICMYQDSEQNIRFSKLIQWRTTGATLIIFIFFALFAQHYSKSGDMAKLLVVLTYLVGAASIYMLVVFQFWQGTERQKIQLITSKLSSLAQGIYNTKSKLAADIERYTILFFMFCAIFAGGFLTLCRLMRWFSG